MEISITLPVSPVLPPIPPGVEDGRAYQPRDTPRLTAPAGDVQGMVALDDGGAAIGLDPLEDLSLAPQWLAWMEWVDECQPYLDRPVAVSSATCR